MSPYPFSECDLWRTFAPGQPNSPAEEVRNVCQAFGGRCLRSDADRIRQKIPPELQHRLSVSILVGGLGQASRCCVESSID